MFSHSAPSPKSSRSLPTRAAEPRRDLSPDGAWLAYNWNGEAYVQPFPGPGGPRQVSAEGGIAPMWARDGRELFYVTRAGVTLAVSVETSPSVRTGRPQVLFAHQYVTLPYGVTRDLAADGRFLVIKPGEEELEPPRIHLVEGWSEELKRRVPTTGSAR